MTTATTAGFSRAPILGRLSVPATLVIVIVLLILP
jgi:hypothetical protein